MQTSVNTEGILTSGYNSSTPSNISKTNANFVFSDLSLDSIRFPGGNLGNLYHPFQVDGVTEANGYGFRRSEFPKNTVFYDVYEAWDQTQTENVIEPFIRWLESINVNKVLYVANVKNGTVNEALWVIDRFAQANIEVIGVELGNELYFAQWGTWTRNFLGQWTSTLMTPQQYVSLATPISQAIRAAHPNIPQAVLGWHNGGATSRAVTLPKANAWNSTIANSGLTYEAYVVHDYLRIESTDSSKSLAEMTSKVIGLTKYRTSGYLSGIFNYFNQYFSGKESWWTEINVEDPFKLIGNTLLHGAIMFEAACELQRLGVDLLSYHNLTSNVIGMSMTWSPKGSNRVNITSFYYTGLMVAQLKNYSTFITASSNDEFHTWRFKNGSQNMICFVNKTTTTQQIRLSSPNTNIYAVHGALHSSNLSDGDSVVDPAYRINSRKNWALAPFSVIETTTNSPSYAAPTGYGILTWND